MFHWQQEQWYKSGGCEQMPKININGITREMTPEEIAEMERLAAEMPVPEPSPEEMIRQQAQEIEELKKALNLLLSGVTEDG